MTKFKEPVSAMEIEYNIENFKKMANSVYTEMMEELNADVKMLSYLSYSELRDLKNSSRYSQADSYCMYKRFRDRYNREMSVSCECPPHLSKPVKFTQTNGVVRVALECDFCHSCKTNGIKKSDYDVDTLPIRKDGKKDPTMWDFIYTLRMDIRRKIDDIKNKCQELMEERAGDSYSIYLMSKKWAIMRDNVLKRDNYLCQSCLTRRAYTAHHLTYRNLNKFGHQPAWDLVSICRPCHDWIHGKGSFSNETPVNEQDDCRI